MKTPDQWLSDMLARSDDFAPGEIDKARAFVEAIQRDAMEAMAARCDYNREHFMRIHDDCTNTDDRWRMWCQARGAELCAADLRALFPKAGP